MSNFSEKINPWCKEEDDLLISAVKKYGKNQWVNVSWLLTRTPKECKSRWYEYLDPKIEIVEWSDEEDKLLLHLVKLIPEQWRIIAPLVGRTMAQCMRRYEFFRDQSMSEDHKGEINLCTPMKTINISNTEKYDTTDSTYLNKNEKAMLLDARTKLSNQGKKAIRKTLEKQLEETRRLVLKRKRKDFIETGCIVPKDRATGYRNNIYGGLF